MTAPAPTARCGPRRWLRQASRPKPWPPLVPLRGPRRRSGRRAASMRRPSPGCCRGSPTRVSCGARRWGRCDDARGERGVPEHRSPRHGRGLHRVSHAAGRSLGHRDADSCRAAAVRQRQASQEVGQDEPPSSRGLTMSMSPLHRSCASITAFSNRTRCLGWQATRNNICGLLKAYTDVVGTRQRRADDRRERCFRRFSFCVQCWGKNHEGRLFMGGPLNLPPVQVIRRARSPVTHRWRLKSDVGVKKEEVHLSENYQRATHIYIALDSSLRQ